MRRCASLLVLLLCGIAVGDAQDGVTGQVVTEDGRPLANVRVTLDRTTGDTPPPVVLTDPFGRFVLPVASEPRYELLAYKAGFARSRVTVTPGAAVAIQMRPGAAIAGRAVDDAGEPIVGARITVERAGSSGVVGSTATDDRGEYRLSVEPGEPFVVVATTRGIENIVSRAGRGQFMVTPSINRTTFPTTAPNMRPTALRLQPGEEQGGIDFTIPVAQSGAQPLSAFDRIGIMVVGTNAFSLGRVGAVIGRVIDPAGRPVPNAVVIALPERGGGVQQRTRTDAAGGFAFGRFGEGPMRVLASRPGYTTDEARRTLAFSAERTSETFELRLVPWSAINGRVLDEFGEAIENARVQLLRVRFEAGRRRLVPVSDVAPQSDDRGQYRLFAVEPGQYIVSAQVGEVRTADIPGYTRSYYPSGVAVADAQLVTVRAGQEVQGIDVLMSRTQTFRVAGRIMPAARGDDRGFGSVQLWPTGADAIIGVPIGATIEQDRFEFRNVPPGRYVMQVYRGRLSSSAEGPFGALPISVVDSDVTDLVVQTGIGSQVTGKVTFETVDPTREPPRAGIELAPVPADFETSPAANWAIAGIGPDWTFSMSGISGARRLLATRVPAGWMVRGIRVNGIDIADRPLVFGAESQSLSDVEVVLTDRVTELSVRVTDARGRIVAGAPLGVFSSDRGAWFPFSSRFRRATTGDDGTVLVSGLPADGYYVVELQDLPEDGSWQDPETLEALTARATYVTVGEAGRAVVQLRR